MRRRGGQTRAGQTARGACPGAQGPGSPREARAAGTGQPPGPQRLPSTEATRRLVLKIYGGSAKERWAFCEFAAHSW